MSEAQTPDHIIFKFGSHLWVNTNNNRMAGPFSGMMAVEKWCYETCNLSRDRVAMAPPGAGVDPEAIAAQVADFLIQYEDNSDALGASLSTLGSDPSRAEVAHMTREYTATHSTIMAIGACIGTLNTAGASLDNLPVSTEDLVSYAHDTINMLTEWAATE